ncbi:MAG: hypothetical protein RLZZ387_1818 [Chloroflexota bacterium]|jgi:hypothetical protein
MSEKKGRGAGWSSAIGWVIFVLVMAGGPILRAVQNALGGGVQLTNLLPYIVGGLVLLSFVASAVKALGRRGGDAGPRMPDRVGPSLPERADMSPPIQPMPPFGGELGLPQMPQLPPSPSYPARRVAEREYVPQVPRFEPVFSPGVLGIGVLGLIALGGAALLVLGGGTP